MGVINCNCNETVAKIRRVQGNPLALAIPLTKVTVTEQGKVEEPYNVPEGAKVEMVLSDAGDFSRYTFEPESIVGNLVTIKDNSTLPAGVYAVETHITEQGGDKLRSKYCSMIEILDCNDSFDDEFDDILVGSATLDEQIFYFAKGDKGDPGEPGEGVAAGGTTGQVLQKKSNTDYDTEWVNPPASGVSSVNGKTGEVTLDAEDVGALPADTPIPSALADLSDDSTHRVVTDSEKSTWNGKQDTINDLSEIRSGAAAGATAVQTETDPTVPSWAKQSNKPSYNASEVGALPSSTKYGATLDMSLNTTDYKLTVSLKDQDGTVLNYKTVDFPIESVVVSGSYDSTNKKIVLTLQNGNTIDVPVGDLVAGLQTEITALNMLDADLVDDTNSTHKFVTTSEKSTWNAKYDKPSSGIPASDIASGVIPTVPTISTNIESDGSSDAKTASPKAVKSFVEGKGYTTNTGTITSVKMNGSTIASSGEADLGTVITSHQDISGKADKSEMSVVDGTGADADKTTITLKSGTSATVLKSHQSLSGKQDKIDSSHKLSADLVEDGSTNKVFTAAEKTKLNGIEAGAQANVKPDWNAASGSSAEILNKPTIPDAQIQSDWNQSDNTQKDFIKNKPTTMGASGANHKSGLVPDTPSTAGTTKFLREDATWAEPSGGGGSVPSNVALLEDASQTAFSPNFDPETDTVHVSAQNLTTAQKTQARTNIGAADASTAVNSSVIRNIVTISQADYTALTSKDNTTLYIIT